MRPLRAEVDLKAIRTNFDLLAGKAGSSRCIAVVKADAYGHGIGHVAKALADKTDKFAVASLDEALELRSAGINKSVMILEGFFSAEEMQEGVRVGNIEWVIHSDEQLAVLKAVSLRAACKVWLKVNTGMNRLGFQQSRILQLLESVDATPAADLMGTVTHFASADQPESDSFRTQLHAVKALRNCLPNNVPLSAANSAGVLLHSDILFDWVRPGIALYGCSPLANRQGIDLGLRPAMRLVSQIIACRDLSQGESVGYGASWRASGTARMGVVAVGYGDGYPRQLGNGTPVIVAGTETKTIGRISMDMTTVDLTSVRSAGVGSEVELWGSHLSADRIAACAKTISYHLLTGVTKRVPRRYRSGTDPHSQEHK